MSSCNFAGDLISDGVWIFYCMPLVQYQYITPFKFEGSYVVYHQISKFVVSTNVDTTNFIITPVFFDSVYVFFGTVKIYDCSIDRHLNHEKFLYAYDVILSKINAANTHRYDWIFST